MKLIFVDFETTGLNPHKDLPIEIAMVIMDDETEEVIYNVEYLINHDDVTFKKMKGMATEFHGITREDLKEGYNMYQVFLQISDAFELMKISKENSIFICQNPSFDRAFFNMIFPPDYQMEQGLPYHWMDLASMFWITHHPKDMILSKDNIADRLGLKSEIQPHRAAQGVRHLMKCYCALKDQDHHKKAC